MGQAMQLRGHFCHLWKSFEHLRDNHTKGGGCQLQAGGGLIDKKKIFWKKNKTFTTLSPLPCGVPSPPTPYFHMHMGCLSQPNTKTGGVGGFIKKHLTWMKPKNHVSTCFLTHFDHVYQKLRLSPPFPHLNKFINLKDNSSQAPNTLPHLTEILI